MGRQGGQKCLIGLVLGTVLYISVFGSHVLAIQLVRNGIPFRARDEVQFIAPNISVEAPEGLEIDPNAPPTRVEVPIEVEIKKEEDVGGIVKEDRMMQQVLSANASIATISTTTTKAPKTTKPLGKDKSKQPPSSSKSPSIADKSGKPEKGDAGKSPHNPQDSGIAGTSTTRGAACGLHNSHHQFNAIILSLGLAIYVANKMFFI